jgi:hypothetical protein
VTLDTGRTLAEPPFGARDSSSLITGRGHDQVDLRAMSS